ncbi:MULTISPECIES: hypothetical protein [Bacillus]|uniref:hypothetical protein n=1 Tax=Bacillus TaxID=1386 RepID=UPI000B3090C8|nr:hypothetical protein CJP14_08560 [Bacillus velezensis]MCB5334848.1 hypothetical protein [Bacillus amyloliquefaciens]UBZ23438.1 hypothetical protein JS608_02579 [Bacillus amyloliquefaciens]
MKILMDLFTTWIFDKVMDYSLGAIIWFVFKSKSKQNEYPEDFEEKRRFRL